MCVCFKSGMLVERGRVWRDQRSGLLHHIERLLQAGLKRVTLEGSG